MVGDGTVLAALLVVRIAEGREKKCSINQCFHFWRSIFTC